MDPKVPLSLQWKYWVVLFLLLSYYFKNWNQRENIVMDCLEKYLFEIPSILAFVICNWGACIIFSLNDYRRQEMNSS